MLFAVSIENLKNLKPHLLEKTLALSITCSKWKNQDKKLLKNKESFEILRFFGLIENI